MATKAPICFITMIIPFLFLLCGCQVEMQSYGMSAYTISAKRLYPEALAIAREQDPSAFLAYVDVDFRTMEDNRPLRIAYTFETQSTPPVWCRVEFTDGKDPGLIVSSHEYPYEASITDQDWLLDSTEALEIAQENGGREFLLRWKPQITALRLQRASSEHVVSGNPPVEWCVVYAVFMSRQRLTVCINAASGQVTRRELTE